MEEKTEDNNKLYIVRSRKNNSFYKGGAGYTTDLYYAKIYGENEIPEKIKDNPNLKVINLNSEEGLEIITSEICKSEKYISIKSKGLGEIICGLSMLKHLFKEIKKEQY